jgi:hypothetical protein
MKKFSPFEIAILTMIIAIIFLSEYYFVVLKNVDKAIFIGLWPPTMIGLLIYLNLKKKE